MSVSNIVLSIMSALKAKSEDYCDLETVAGMHTLVFKNQTMLTLVRYDGMLSQVDPSDFARMIEQVADKLNIVMSNSGYKFACVFRKDLDAFSDLSKIESKQKRTAKNLDLDVDDIIEEAIDAARYYVYEEEVYFGLMTNPDALDKVEKESVINAAKKPKSYVRPAIKNAQNIFHESNLLLSKHNEFVETFISAFQGKDFHVSMAKVNVVKALSFIRHQVQPNSSPRNWTPAIAIGQNAMRHKYGSQNYRNPVFFPIDDNREDMSHMLPPTLPRQIMSQEIEELGAAEGLPPNTIRCDNRLYSSVYMDIPPSDPRIFNELFAAFNNTAFTDTRGNLRTMPWSITFLISGDGMAGTMIKAALKNIVGLAPPSTNANMKAAYEQLSYIKNENRAIVGVQCSAMTWVEDVDDNKRQILVEQKNRLKYSMESWGGAKVIDNVGDPVLGWCSNMIGLSTHHVGTKGAVPLRDILYMLPITRPASAFKNGTIINYTRDGKLMPLEKFSAQQKAWFKLMVGDSGSGKSVMMNNDLFETCLMDGLERLPLITVIDKGDSSTGFINLIRDRLPPHKKHLAVTKKLRIDDSYAINPFDTKVGLTRPLANEKRSMIAFLTALLTPNEADKPYRDTQSFVTFLVDLAFDSIQENSEIGNPKMYEYAQNDELDAYILENDLLEYETDINGNIDYRNPVDTPTYFELVRRLHVIGESHKEGSAKRFKAWRARDLAHRLAMPTLQDLVSLLNDAKIEKTYKNEVETGEKMPEYANRAFADVLRSYPCFTKTTQFDVDTARVVSLDLQDVVSVQNRKQSSLFVQIARMIAIKKYSLTKEDVESPLIQPVFKDFYRKEYMRLSGERKVLAVDEMHNYRGDDIFMEMLGIDAREGRKWNLELMLASQYLTDFASSKENQDTDKDLLKYVTSLCLCSTPEGDNLDLFRTYFDPTHKILPRTLESISLNRSGLTYLSCVKSKTKKYFHSLTLKVSPKRLWSLTTTSEDKQIRSYAYQLTNNDRTKAIAALAFWLPSGAKEQVIQLRDNLSELNDPDEIERQSKNLIERLANNAVTQYEAHQAALRAQQSAAVV